MMINPVSYKPVSFRGTTTDETEEARAENTEEQSTKAQATEEQSNTDKKKNLSAEDIQRGVNDFQKKAEAVGDGVDDVTKTVTDTTAKVTGSALLIGQAIKKFVPKPVYEYFVSEIPKTDANGEVLLDSEGKEVVKKKLTTMSFKGKSIPKLALWGAGTAAAIGIAKLIHSAAKSKGEKSAEEKPKTDVVG